MEIVSIFADRLTAFRYDTGHPDEFSRLFSHWQDPLFLVDFFSDNIDDLQGGFFGTISLQTAVMQTRAEARALESKLRQAPDAIDLDSIFEPLKLEEPTELTRSKAKGNSHRSWLRLYAIRLESNVYVVTGGAIKLTRSMQDREHTRQELGKFERCKSFLREQGITDVDGLSEMII